MDTKAIIKEAKAKFNYNLAKKYLKDKYQSKLIVAEQGGLWKVTPELIVFLDTAGVTHLVIQDSYENPVKVDRFRLYTVLRDTYTKVMNEWHDEWETLKKNR